MLNPTNPALAVVYLLGAVFGAEIIPQVMVYCYIAEIFAAGILAYIYLSTFAFGEIPKLLAAYMYAFSGFMIVSGQNYRLAVVPALLMLELLMTERCLKHRRWAGLVLATALTIASDTMAAYTILLFTGFYILLRLLLKNCGGKLYIKEAFRVLWPIALGICLSMLLLLPSLCSIYGVSGGTTEETSLFGRLFALPSADYVRTAIERLFSCAAQGINNNKDSMNYYEGPCLFFTTLFIPVLWQYICLLPGRIISKKRRGMAIVLFLLGIPGILMPMAGTVFGGFTKTSSQYMFLVMAAFAVMSAVTYEEIFGKRRFSIMGAFLASVTLVFGYGWLVLGELETSIDLVLIAHILCGTVMLALLKVGSAGNSVYEDVAPRQAHSWLALGVKHVGFILSLFLMANVAAELTANFQARGLVDPKASQAALSEGKISSRFALLKDQRLSLLEDEEVQEALTKLREEDKDWYRIEKLYSATGAMDAPFQNYHGISNYSKTMNANVLEFVDSEWADLYLWDRNHLTYRPDNANLSLSRLLGIRYLLVKKELIDWYNGEKNYDVGKVPEGFTKAAVCGEVTIYRDDTMPGMFSYYPTSVVSENTSVSFDDRQKDARIEVLANAREDAFSLEVSSAKDGLLFAAIPYEQGWKAFVDGREAKIVPAETGFSGLWLSAGEHTVRFVYVCPGFVAGVLISLV
ncbi:MAG: YfhO family protein, partial [bacterium]